MNFRPIALAVILYVFIAPSLRAQEGIKSEIYKILKIKSIHKYYVIYAERNGSIYKIVSQKKDTMNCNKIKKNQEYKLKLESNVFIGGGEVTCRYFDEKTVICKEKGCVWDLFSAVNLSGLCITGNE